MAIQFEHGPGTATQFFEERTSSDGLPSAGSVDGAEVLELESDTNDEWYRLTFYEFGAMQAVDHASEQLETWVYDRSAGTYVPIWNMRLNGNTAADSPEVQLRNRGDTDSFRIIFDNDTGVPKIATEASGTDLLVAPRGDLNLAPTDGGAVLLGADPSAALGAATKQYVDNLTAVVRKSAIESVTSSTTLQDDDELMFSIGADETWVGRFALYVDGAAGGDIKVGLSVPSGATSKVGAHGHAEGATSYEGGFRNMVGNPATNFGTLDPSLPTLLLVEFSVANGSTAGSVTLQWAQQTSNSTATRVEAGSFLVAHKV